jgi:DNA-binding NarL/FixJ family response regulator
MLILILTLDGSAHFALAAVHCGAQCLLMKSLATEHLVTALTTLLRGERYFPDSPKKCPHPSNFRASAAVESKLNERLAIERLKSC